MATMLRQPKKEERKDRLHQNYLRRKANGKQREYEERTKSEKRKKMEEKKAALRAEDMAKGVYKAQVEEIIFVELIYKG